MSGPTHIRDILAQKTIVLEGADVLSARGFTQVPVVAADQDEANRLAASASAGLNHALPDLVVAAADDLLDLSALIAQIHEDITQETACNGKDHYRYHSFPS